MQKLFFFLPLLFLMACTDSNPVNDKDSIPPMDSAFAKKKEHAHDSVIYMVDYSLVTAKQISEDVHITWLSPDSVRYLVYYYSLLNSAAVSLKGIAVDTSHGRLEKEQLVQNEPVLMRSYTALNSACPMEIRVEKTNLRRAFIVTKGNCKAGTLGELSSPSALKMNCYWLTRDTTRAIFP